jgi:hypothetical protein
MADWQPIETAPKDGTDILVYRPKANKYVPKVGVDWFDASYLGGKWMKSNQYFQPTRWMPMPEPPTD